MTDHPFDPALFEGWISLAADHLRDALETALDELQRDRDWLPEEHNGDEDGVNCPNSLDERTNCVNLALARFKGMVS